MNGVSQATGTNTNTGDGLNTNAVQIGLFIVTLIMFDLTTAIGSNPCIPNDGNQEPNPGIFDELQIYDSYVNPQTLYSTPCGMY